VKEKAMKIRAYSALSLPSQKKGFNEDAFKVNSERQIYLVADGYGGSGIGDVASKEILEDI
jgi:serine/threonine protein phosphatase PrpC